ncbi:MAG: SDR family NAD(P)-dependent oxidoreductase [Pseudomonadota bacterium]|nr:SDR family NAD(P)-dependent oxidoreductase [Pseudomonadota bacterium]
MTHHSRDWHNRRIWIVGASSGIGRATAELLLQQGAHVGLTARSTAALQELAEQYPNATVLPADVTDLAQLQLAFQQFCATQPLDLYLHCAADYLPMRAWTLDSPRMQDMMQINYGGVLNALSLVTPDFLARQSGHIAIIASVAGYMGLPKALAYGPTKAALINLCESLYLDLKPHGIRVQVINSGFVATALTAKNDFKMPALLSPEQAAEALVHGLESTGFEITFPKRFTRVLQLIRCLPYGLRLKLLGKIDSTSSATP